MTLKEAIPKLSSDEMSQRLRKFPVTKNEIIEYLLRVHKDDRKLEASTYKKLLASKGFQEII
jgi:hypothetical protein